MHLQCCRSGLISLTPVRLNYLDRSMICDHTYACHDHLASFICNDDNNDHYSTTKASNYVRLNIIEECLKIPLGITVITGGNLLVFSRKPAKRCGFLFEFKRLVCKIAEFQRGLSIRYAIEPQLDRSPIDPQYPSADISP